MRDLGCARGVEDACMIMHECGAAALSNVVSAETGETPVPEGRAVFACKAKGDTTAPPEGMPDTRLCARAGRTQASERRAEAAVR